MTPERETTKGNNMTTKEKYDVVDAVCKCMALIGNVTKDSKNNHMGYAFASEQKLLLAVQPALTKAGLAIERREVEVLKYERINGNRPKWHALVKVTYDLILSAGCAINADNMRITHVALGSGEDSSDKAIAKAQTMAFKYLLRNAFAIPTGDDPDRTENSEPDQGYHNNNYQRRSRERKRVVSTAKPSQQTIDSFKNWCLKYDGFDFMVEFCKLKSKTKSSPLTWPDEQITKFKESFESGKLQDQYNNFKSQCFDDRQFPPDEIDMTEVPF